MAVVRRLVEDVLARGQMQPPAGQRCSRLELRQWLRAEALEAMSRLR